MKVKELVVWGDNLLFTRKLYHFCKVHFADCQGAQDKDVPLKYAKDIFKKLNYKKELELVENTDHHFESYEAINKLNEISWKWLRQNL